MGRGVMEQCEPARAPPAPPSRGTEASMGLLALKVGKGHRVSTGLERTRHWPEPGPTNHNKPPGRERKVLGHPVWAGVPFIWERCWAARRCRWHSICSRRASSICRTPRRRAWSEIGPRRFQVAQGWAASCGC